MWSSDTYKKQNVGTKTIIAIQTRQLHCNSESTGRGVTAMVTEICVEIEAVADNLKKIGQLKTKNKSNALRRRSRIHLTKSIRCMKQ